MPGSDFLRGLPPPPPPSPLFRNMDIFSDIEKFATLDPGKRGITELIIKDEYVHSARVIREAETVRFYMMPTSFD